MLNDPVLLRLADDRFWLSIADSDLLLYLWGLATGAGFDVTIDEPDVNPLAIQTERRWIAADLFGSQIGDLGFFILLMSTSLALGKLSPGPASRQKPA